MTSETISLIVLAVLFVVGALLYWRSNGAITPERLATAANLAVMAAEQYRSTGQLQSNDEQLQFAIDFVQRLIPAANNIPDRLIIDAIHSFVPAANAVTAQIEAVRGDLHTTPATLTPLIPPKPTVGTMGLEQ